MQFREPGKGAAGYLSWGMGANETIELQPKLGLIQGIAGVGLVLLALLPPGLLLGQWLYST